MIKTILLSSKFHLKQIVVLVVLMALGVTSAASGEPYSKKNIDEYVARALMPVKSINKWDGVLAYYFMNGSLEKRDVFDSYAQYFSDLTGIRIVKWNEERSDFPNLIIFCGDVKNIMVNENVMPLFYKNGNYRSHAEYYDRVKSLSGLDYYLSTSVRMDDHCYKDMYLIWSTNMSKWDVHRQVKILYYTVLSSPAIKHDSCGSVMSKKCEYDFKYLSPIDEAYMRAFNDLALPSNTSQENAARILKKMMSKRMGN